MRTLTFNPLPFWERGRSEPGFFPFGCAQGFGWLRGVIPMRSRMTQEEGHSGIWSLTRAGGAAPSHGGEAKKDSGILRRGGSE